MEVTTTGPGWARTPKATSRVILDRVDIDAQRVQGDQLGALGLVVNAIALFNTRYMDRAVNYVRAHGRTLDDRRRGALSAAVSVLHELFVPFIRKGRARQ